MYVKLMEKTILTFFNQTFCLSGPMCHTVNVLKFRILFSFCSKIKCGLSRLEITKCLSELQTGKTLIRLLLHNQSDPGLFCFSRLSWQATTVQNFRTVTVRYIIHRFIQKFPHKIVTIFLPIIFSICFGCSKEPFH